MFDTEHGMKNFDKENGNTVLSAEFLEFWVYAFSPFDAGGCAVALHRKIKENSVD